MIVAEFDSPWKEALDDFLQPFFGLFAPLIERMIDWETVPESLDNELAKLFPDSPTGKGIVDRLYKVRLRNGSFSWVLIHIEVQSQRDDDFSERVFRYFYRLRDKFDLPLICFVVLADDSPSWRPDEYVYDYAGTRMQFTFPIVKLTDYRSRIAELEESSNPFALIVLAHLQSQSARQPEARLDWKRRITRNLLERELDEDARWKVLRLVDWLLDLPIELNDVYWYEVREWKERKTMPYVTGLERMLKEEGRKEGRQEGRQEGWQEGRQEGAREELLNGLRIVFDFKFGEAGKEFFKELKTIADLAKLKEIQGVILASTDLDVLRKLL